MEQEYREHTVAVYSSELERLSLRQMYQSQYQHQEEQQHACRTQESFLLSYRTEDEVGILLRHELQLGLGSVQESLSLQATRTDGYLTLMYIISGTRQVFVQSQQHVDTHSLMRFHHVVQHVIGTVEEGNTSHCEYRNQEIVAEAGPQTVIHQESDHHRTEQQLHPYDVKRNDVGGEECKDERDAHRVAQDDESMLPVARIAVHQSCREDLHQQQHRELSHRGVGIPHRHVLVLDTHHKVNHHRDSGKEDGTRHSLAVKHQEEGGIYQCRTRLALSHDTYHRQNDDAHSRHEMLHLMDIESIAAHKLRHSQRRSKLTELGRLQSQRSQHQPGVRTLDAMRIEYRGKKQQYQHGIDHVGEGIEKTVVHHQDDEAQRNGGTYPYNLHTRTGTQTEDIVVAIGIAGTADTDPAEAEQCQIDADGPPVERTENTSWLFII